MDYEIAYKEALNEAIIAYKDEDRHLKATLERIFPELKESEDERVKRIFHSISSKISLHLHDIFTEEEFQCFDAWSIAWLEKQGNKLAETNVCAVDLSSCSEEYRKAYYDGYNKCNRDWLRKQDKKVQGKSALEAIKEEKVDNANKVESKFKVGDWLQYRNAQPFYVEEITSQGYVNGISCLPFSWEGEIHLWTIADAQDGDVLVASDGSIFIFAGVVDCACKYYITLTATNDVKINKEKKGGYWETSRAVYPATKEQRDLLFQKMKESGWGFDFEKKELKKIMEK